jgi:hypothetical protein
MSPPGYEAGEPPPISTKCSPGHPPATQNQERERANDSTLGLVPKVSNQCRDIFSKVGLATFILSCLSILRSILSNLSSLEPPWENHSCLIGGVRVCWRLIVVFRLDLQADKSPVVVKGPFFPRVVNPRYRIRGTNVWRKRWFNKAK